MTAKIVSINTSPKTGQKKRPVPEACLIKDLGIEGDGHSGTKLQVSLLASESIAKLDPDLKPGDFAENITTSGIDLISLPLGSILKLGNEAEIRIVKKGKDCHTPCHIFKQHGQCVMPTEGVFAEVIKSGRIRNEDPIATLSSPRQ